MSNILIKDKIVPKLINFKENTILIFKQRSKLRSDRSKLVDLIPLNQTVMSDCPRSEKID
jgi:hypothetical protein